MAGVEAASAEGLLIAQRPFTGHQTLNTMISKRRGADRPAERITTSKHCATTWEGVDQ